MKHPKTARKKKGQRKTHSNRAINSTRPQGLQEAAPPRRPEDDKRAQQKGLIHSPGPEQTAKEGCGSGGTSSSRLGRARILCTAFVEPWNELASIASARARPSPGGACPSFFSPLFSFPSPSSTSSLACSSFIKEGEDRLASPGEPPEKSC